MSDYIPIDDLEQLGALVRTARKQQGLRQDEVGRFSHTFVGELEAGKPTAQIGKVFAALKELGFRVHLELPPGIRRPDP